MLDAYTVVWSWLTSKLTWHTRTHRGDAQHILYPGLDWKDVRAEKQCPCFAFSAANFLHSDLGSIVSDHQDFKTIKTPQVPSPLQFPWQHAPALRDNLLAGRRGSLTLTTEPTKLLQSRSPVTNHHGAAYRSTRGAASTATTKRRPNSPNASPPGAPPPRPVPAPQPLPKPCPRRPGQPGPGAPGDTGRRGQTKGRRPPPRRCRHGRPGATRAASGARPSPASRPPPAAPRPAGEEARGGSQGCWGHGGRGTEQRPCGFGLVAVATAPRGGRPLPAASSGQRSPRGRGGNRGRGGLRPPVAPPPRPLSPGAAAAAVPRPAPLPPLPPPPLPLTRLRSERRRRAHPRGSARHSQGGWAGWAAAAPPRGPSSERTPRVSALPLPPRQSPPAQLTLLLTRAAQSGQSECKGWAFEANRRGRHGEGVALRNRAGRSRQRPIATTNIGGAAQPKARELRLACEPSTS